MEKSINSREMTKRRRKFFRKQLVIPAEHGSWSWLLVPYFVGLLVAGEWNLPTFLVLIGGLAGFLMRQPALAWMRIRAGRGRKADQPLAAAWALGLAAIAGLCLIGLLATGRIMLLWLLIPMSVIFVVYLLAARRQRASIRTLWMELAGAVGLAAMAPSAYIAATGQLDNTAWLLWSLMAGQNALGVLYVRLRIADTHGRPMARAPVFWGHAVILALVVLVAYLEALPWLAVAPFAIFLGRAIWATIRPRPVANIKHFGFSEIGFEILGGMLIAAGWLI